MAKMAKFGTENKAPRLPRQSPGGPMGESGGSHGRVWGVPRQSRHRLGSLEAEYGESHGRVSGVQRQSAGSTEAESGEDTRLQDSPDSYLLSPISYLLSPRLE